MPCIIPLSRGDHLPKIKMAHGHRSLDSHIAHPIFVFPNTLATFAWIHCLKCTSIQCLTLHLVSIITLLDRLKFWQVTVAKNDCQLCSALKCPSVRSFIYLLASNEGWLLIRVEKRTKKQNIGAYKHSGLKHFTNCFDDGNVPCVSEGRYERGTGWSQNMAEGFIIDPADISSYVYMDTNNMIKSLISSSLYQVNVPISRLWTDTFCQEKKYSERELELDNSAHDARIFSDLTLSACIHKS